MLFKIVILFLATLYCCQSVYVYSSFWAPLFNPRILNYRVDSKFDPEAGMKNREAYERNFGYRGKKLIADLGNGKGPYKLNQEENNYDDVRFYYTYNGANNNPKDVHCWTKCSALPISRGLPRPLPGHQTTEWKACLRYVFRRAVTTKELYCPIFQIQ